jgi:hypothetical protein
LDFKSLKKAFASYFPSQWGTIKSPYSAGALPFKTGLVSSNVDQTQC